MLDTLTSADFSPYLNQTFRIHAESSRSLEAELIEVSELGPDPTRDEEVLRKRAFSIVLRGPREPLLPQRIYQVEHEELGMLGLFLVPIGPDGEGMRYEAVFT